MGHTQAKPALITEVRRQKAFWEALLALVREEDMLASGLVEDWTFKDVVAHLTGWRRRTVDRFAAARAKGSLTAPFWPSELGEDVPSVNEWIYLTSRERPLAEVLLESRRVWEELVALVETLPSEDLMEPGRFEYMEGAALGPANLHGSFGHLHEHAAQICDWLARKYDAARSGPEGGL